MTYTEPSFEVMDDFIFLSQRQTKGDMNTTLFWLQKVPILVSSVHIMNPAVGCHYFLPGPQLPSQPLDITAFRPVPTYTGWWQRHIGVRNLPSVCIQRRIKPMTSWLQVWRSTTVPRCHLPDCSQHQIKASYTVIKSQDSVVSTLHFDNWAHWSLGRKVKQHRCWEQSSWLPWSQDVMNFARLLMMRKQYVVICIQHYFPVYFGDKFSDLCPVLKAGMFTRC